VGEVYKNLKILAGRLFWKVVGRLF